MLINSISSVNNNRNNLKNSNKQNFGMAITRRAVEKGFELIGDNSFQLEKLHELVRTASENKRINVDYSPKNQRLELFEKESHFIPNTSVASVTVNWDTYMRALSKKVEEAGTLATERTKADNLRKSILSLLSNEK